MSIAAAPAAAVSVKATMNSGQRITSRRLAGRTGALRPVSLSLAVRCTAASRDGRNGAATAAGPVRA